MHLLDTNTISYILENKEGVVKKILEIEDDDILIGALALEHDAVLITNNEKHFSKIEGLKILALY